MIIDNKNNREITKYLEAYHAGQISKGLDTGLLKLDDSLRFKKGQLTIINGLDNVGKQSGYFGTILLYRLNIT